MFKDVWAQFNYPHYKDFHNNFHKAAEICWHSEEKKKQKIYIIIYVKVKKQCWDSESLVIFATQGPSSEPSLQT